MFISTPKDGARLLVGTAIIFMFAFLVAVSQLHAAAV